MTNPRTIEFITTDFEFAHGRRPGGRGGWAFCEDRRANATSPDIIWISGLYSEAKLRARRIAAERGIAALWVLS